MPAYSRAHSIEAVLQKVVTLPPDFFRDPGLDVESVFVGEGAYGTPSGAPFRFTRHATLPEAITQATRDFCLIHDPGREFDPGDYGKLLTPLLEGRSEIKAFRTFVNRKFSWFVDLSVSIWRKVGRIQPRPSTSIIAIGIAKNAAE